MFICPAFIVQKFHDFNSFVNDFNQPNLIKQVQVLFLLEKLLYENEPQKPQNLKKMLRKPPASNA